MNKNRKRVLAALLCGIICLGQFTACSDKKTGDETKGTNETTPTSGGETETTATGETETERLQPDLPEANYNGYDFRMLGKGTHLVHWSSKDLTAEEITGDPINDAVYNRNQLIGEKYNVKFVELAVADYFNQGAELALSCNAQTDEYDMVALKPEGVVSSFITNGYIMDLNDIPNMDLSKPWYDQNSITGMSIDNKVFCVMGDMLTMDDDATGAVFFNKKLAISNDLPDMYGMVKEGTWTIDKLTEFATTAATDANGDGVMKAEDDTWGALSEYAATFALISGCGKTMVTKDADDIPQNTTMDEGYIAMYEKVLKLQNNFDVTLYAESLSGYADVWTDCMDVTFQSDRALFNICWLNRASLFRDMETDFGILPLPKYDENQENYSSFVHMYCANTIAIPKTGQDFARTGVIIEALSAESMYTLKPAYYDKTLKYKSSRDVESTEMLDIIFATRIYDLGYMFNWGGVYSSVGSLAGTNGQDISGYASKLSKISKVFTKTRDKTIEDISEDE